MRTSSTTITLNTGLALDRLKLGDIIAMLTKTVYGLAVDAHGESAIKKFFTMKNTPSITHLFYIRERISSASHCS